MTLQPQIDKAIQKSNPKCQYDTTVIEGVCPACLQVNKAHRAKLHKSIKSLFRHIGNCKKFSDIDHPTKTEAIQLLESLSIAIGYRMVIV